MHLEADLSLLHRARAAVALGATWAIPWALTGVAFITWRVFLGRPQFAFPLQYWARFALIGALVPGALGFVAGVLFAITIGRTARGRTVDDLSLAYAARWGAIAGAISVIILPLIGVVALPGLVVGGSFFAVVGAGSAIATLAIARRPVAHVALAPAVGEDEGSGPSTFERQPNER